MREINLKIEQLKDYFNLKDETLIVFLFGSYAQARETESSDFDVAVYLREESLNSAEEIIDDIRFKVTQIIGREIDLVCLNDAPAILVSNIIKTGLPLAVKDKRLYWELYLRKSIEAEDFLHFLEEFRSIKNRATSLSPEEKERLMLRMDYLDDELKEKDRFQRLTWQEYKQDKDKRRLLERWAENILNATIDIAKIVLASEKKMMPRSSEEALQDFSLLAGLSEEEARRFAKFAGLRNILAHEYLESIYTRIQTLIKEFLPCYEKIHTFLEKYLKP